MEYMDIREIAHAIGCETDAVGSVNVVSTDSRDIQPGCLFVALEGECFDGHDYVARAFSQGAGWAVIHHHICDLGDVPSRCIFRVKDTKAALIAIGGAYRSKFNFKCIGITGSVGKTTTKDMVASVLSSGFNTLKTEGNLNNEIGMPKTLFRLTPDVQVAVIEMGMQGFGEIAALATAARPDVGLITNVGVSHLEYLKTRENILRAKLELADALPDGGSLLLCGDNDLLLTVKQPRLNVLFYGLDDASFDYFATDMREENGSTWFTLLYEKGVKRVEDVKIPCIGRHNVCNALAAFAAGHVFGMNETDCARALMQYTPSGMRQKVVNWRDMTVVEDCYNASPDSVRAAMVTLGNFHNASRRIAVLGDMLELGEIEEQAHREIGALAVKQGIDVVLAYGVQAEHICEGALEANGQAQAFHDKELLLEAVQQALCSGCVLWVKGSHGMHLEELIQALYKSYSGFTF